MTDICKTVKVKPWGDGQGDFVEINATDFDKEKHELFDAPPAPPPLPFVPPPPPGAPDPLDSLGADWKHKHADELKKIAAAVSGGRSVENKHQAIEVIEAALKAKAK